MATVQFGFATAHKANGIARPEFARLWRHGFERRCQKIVAREQLNRSRATETFQEVSSVVAAATVTAGFVQVFRSGHVAILKGLGDELLDRALDVLKGVLSFEKILCNGVCEHVLA